MHVYNCDPERAMTIERAGVMPQSRVKRQPLVLSPTGSSGLPPEAIIRQELTREGSVGGGDREGLISSEIGSVLRYSFQTSTKSHSF